MNMAIYVDFGSYIGIFYKTWIDTPLKENATKILEEGSNFLTKLGTILSILHQPTPRLTVSGH